MANRWWVYQSERFPVLAHGLLIAAFSYSAVSFSALLRGQAQMPDARKALVAFATSFLFFLQLRIADEFKDFEEDARFRPYRPVPRGLVSLRELGILGTASALVQLGLALWLQPSLVFLLSLAWIYLALMSKEFFVGAWLTEHPMVYMVSHMAIIPLVDLYATACDWLPAGEGPPRGLPWFLVVSYFNGMIIEIGRKIRAPMDEEPGVITYSFAWGRRQSVFAWLGAMLLTALCAEAAAFQVGFSLPVACLLSLLLIGAGLRAGQFLREPGTVRSKRIESLSGVWTLLMYLSLGAIPLAWRWFSATREA